MYNINKNVFKEYLNFEVGSDNTRKTYLRCVDKFLKQTNGEITVRSVEIFKNYLLESGLSRKTINLYLIAIRCYLGFLKKKGETTIKPEEIELAQTKEKEIEILTSEETEKLLECTCLNLRDKAIVHVLYSTGLRIAELVSLNKGHLKETSEEMSVQGKGGKIRVVFVSDRARKVLKEYLQSREDTCVAMFVSEKGQRRTIQLVQRTLKTVGKECLGGKRVTPHILRHCFATRLLEAGADIKSIQTMLGHSFITTTMRYTHVSDKHLKETFLKYHK